MAFFLSACDVAALAGGASGGYDQYQVQARASMGYDGDDPTGPSSDHTATRVIVAKNHSPLATANVSINDDSLTYHHNGYGGLDSPQPIPAGDLVRLLVVDGATMLTLTVTMPENLKGVVFSQDRSHVDRTLPITITWDAHIGDYSFPPTQVEISFDSAGTAAVIDFSAGTFVIPPAALGDPGGFIGIYTANHVLSSSPLLDSASYFEARSGTFYSYWDQTPSP